MTKREKLQELQDRIDSCGKIRGVFWNDEIRPYYDIHIGYLDGIKCWYHAPFCCYDNKRLYYKFKEFNEEFNLDNIKNILSDCEE